MTAELWTVGRLLQWTADYLKTHEADSPRLDAEVLLADSLGCSRIDLYTRFEETPDEAVRTKFRELVRRRAEGAPVAYLVGRREFFSLSFRVTPDVLIPRPETELLVVAVLDAMRGAGERGGDPHEMTSVATPSSLQDPIPDRTSATPHILSIADIGTGSGILAVCLAKHLPACRVTAVDISPTALKIARENSQSHGVANRIDFFESDLFDSVPAEQTFDYVVSNPPYVAENEMAHLPRDVREFEPRGALLAGRRGTEVVERLIPQSAERLRPGGRLLIEIGPTIHDAARALLEADGRFAVGPTIRDLARLPRVIQGTKT